METQQQDELDLDPRGLQSVRFANENTAEFMENNFTAYEVERLILLLEQRDSLVMWKGIKYEVNNVYFEAGNLAFFEALSRGASVDANVISASYDIKERSFATLLPDRSTVKDFLENWVPL